MNGVHDLGGMQDFGPVEREQDEPVFHEDWERTVYAISRAMRAAGISNIDEGRHAIERMDPAEYLNSSYYERWLVARTQILLEKGVIAESDLEARAGYFEEHPEAPAIAAVSRPLPEPGTLPVLAEERYEREPAGPARFAAGDRVITRVMQPKGHTRLPRYARGKRGIVERLHGTHIFPDTNAHGLGEHPQPLYSVRFDAVELWGDTAEPQQTVNIDCWETYLLPG